VAWSEEVASRVASVRRDVADAAARAGRSPADVTIVAVTKTLPPDAVRVASEAGLPDVGENYVQEARDKQARTVCAARWHLIGTLQRNKAKAAARLFDRVHALDGPQVADALDAAAAERSTRLRVLVQVNTAPDLERHGVRPEELPALVRHLAGCGSLALDGLMTIAPPHAAPDETRRHFRLLRELRDDTAEALGLELVHLSMGMSEDFLIAVEEGATLLRLGRALFGSRNEGPWREEP
jgi:pyridoxal phosphate enzyme (YggS family)